MDASSEQRKRDLMQKQSLPLEAKIILTQQRIREWYDHWDGQVYISYSGGKDSTVLLHLVKDMYPDVPAVYVDTGLEYPQVRRHAMAHADVVLRPAMRFDQVIKIYGYPVVSKEVAHAVRCVKQIGGKSKDYYMLRFDGKLLTKDGEKSSFNIEKWKFLLDADFPISSQCCDVMKKAPIKAYAKETGRKAIIGTMADESRLRMVKYLKFGCNAYDSKEPTSKPLSIWLEQDILQYIKRNGLEIASVYGEIVERDQLQGQTSMFPDQYGKLMTTGVSRTGCVFCAFGAQCEKKPNRFQRLKETHPKLYAYCMGGGEYKDGKWQPSKDGLGMGHVLDYIGVSYD